MSADRTPHQRTLLVIGATGFVGGAIARHQAAAGWSVSGLARTDVAAAALEAEGIRAVRGDLAGNVPQLLDHAGGVDAVVVAAQLDADTEQPLLARLAERLVGRTLLFVSGSGVFLERTGGGWSEASYTEDDDFPVEPLARGRRDAELAVLAAASGGVRAVVVRPGAIWGPGDHGIVSMVYRAVADLGAAGYVGQGRNIYAEVHIDDVARLVDAALERGTPGALYHAVAGETPARWVAEAVARDLDIPTRSLSMQEAEQVWGPFGALIASASSRPRAPRSRGELGWVPQHPDMLAEVGDPRLRALAGRP